MQRFNDPTQAIHVAVGEVFAIALASNPTTGYTWQADADPRYLELIDQEFEPRGGGIGAGGHEVFRFHALQTGQAEIGLVYCRPWDRETRDTERFQVAIA